MTKNDSQVDRGWAWVILAAAFLAVFLCSTIYMSGIYNLVFLDVYGESKYLTAWCAALHSSMISFMGPITSTVINSVGYRITVFIGAALCMIGYISCAFVSSFSMVFLTYGFIAGAGVGLAYMPAFVLLGFYFKRYRNIAYGVVTTGAGLGTMIFAPLTHYLIDEYGYKGSMGIMAAIMSHLFIAGAVLRPIQWEIDTEEIAESIVNQENHDIRHQSTLSSSLNIHHLQSKSHLYLSSSKLSSLHNLKSNADAETDDSKQLLATEGFTKTDDCVNVNIKNSDPQSPEEKQNDSGEGGKVNEYFHKDDKLTPLANDYKAYIPENDVTICENDLIENTDIVQFNNAKNLNDKTSVLHITIPGENYQQKEAVFSNSSVLLNVKSNMKLNGLNTSSTNISPLVSPSAMNENELLKSPERLSKTTASSPVKVNQNVLLKPNGLPLLLLNRNNNARTVAGSHPNLYTDKNNHFPSIYYSTENIKQNGQHINSEQILKPHMYTGNVFSRMSSDFIAQSYMSMSSLNLSRKPVRFDETDIVKEPHSESACSRMANSYGKLLVKKDFIIFCANLLLVNFGIAAAYVHIPAFGMANGSTSLQASRLLSVMGISNILSRLLTGLATNINGLDIFVVYMGSCGLTGIVLCIGPFLGTSYYGQIIFAFMFGLYANCYIALMSPLTIELVGIESLSHAYGLELFMCGIGFLIGPTAAGTTYIAGSIVMMLIPLCSPRK